MKSYQDLDVMHDINVVKCVTDAQDKIANGRESKPGTLRGGSVGAIIDNRVHGVCHRKAYLRFNGIETPLDRNIELMTSQGEKNEEIWFEELQRGLPEHLYVMDQTQFECTWTTNSGVSGSGSPDLIIWDRRTELPVLGLELKNISSQSKMKSAHYELRPTEDHIIQAANYSIRMGDQYLGGKPLPYQLIYSNRSIHQIFSMSEKVKKVILDNPVDVQFRFGKPMSVLPFHRVYDLLWEEDDTLSYWTDGMRQKIRTGICRQAIDDYYEAVAVDIDAQNDLGPRPTTKHIDGKSAYSPCGYCEFNEICDSYERRSTTEFKDHARKYALDKWKERS